MLGGGDGLAVARDPEVSAVERITLVDLDPEMTRLFSTNPLLTALNHGSLTVAAVHVVNADAFLWLDSATDVFDFIVVDFPDPTNYSLGKLYTTVFYRGARAPSQRTAARSSCRAHRRCSRASRSGASTKRSSRPAIATFPYHVYVPSFGEWGFVLAGAHDYAPPAHAARRTCASWPPRRSRQLFEFPADMRRVAMPSQPSERPGAGPLLEAEWREISR